MFQVEPILWLQAHASTPLTWLMSTVTLLGYAPAYAAAALVALVFGVRRRPVLAVALALILSSLLAEGLKAGFALPRPSDVDSRVVTLGPGAGARPAAAVERGGAPGFWSLPSAAAIAVVRARPHANYGFPSGHVAAAVSLVLAAGLFFGSWRFAVSGLPWPLLMALSRLYLGRHFLADVIGGMLVGCLAFAVTALLLRGRTGSGSRRAGRATHACS
jgi:membrane-associated phospholipid phosphatase